MMKKIIKLFAAALAVCCLCAGCGPVQPQDEFLMWEEAPQRRDHPGVSGELLGMTVAEGSEGEEVTNVEIRYRNESEYYYSDSDCRTIYIEYWYEDAWYTVYDPPGNGEGPLNEFGGLGRDTRTYEKEYQLEGNVFKGDILCRSGRYRWYDSCFGYTEFDWDLPE